VRGRATFKRGPHPTASAHWGEPATDAPADIAALVALGRTLRRHHGRLAAAADVRSTLQAMERLYDDGQAQAALAGCDSLTAAALAYPLARAGVAPDGRGLTAAALREAAASALGGTGPATRGARPKGYQTVLAEAIVRLWTVEHGDPVPPRPFDPPSPIVEFAGRVFDRVERRPMDRVKLARLLAGAISTS